MPLYVSGSTPPEPEVTLKLVRASHAGAIRVETGEGHCLGIFEPNVGFRPAGGVPNVKNRYLGMVNDAGICKIGSQC